MLVYVQKELTPNSFDFSIALPPIYRSILKKYKKGNNSATTISNIWKNRFKYSYQESYAKI